MRSKAPARNGRHGRRPKTARPGGPTGTRRSADVVRGEKAVGAAPAGASAGRSAASGKDLHRPNPGTDRPAPARFLWPAAGRREPAPLAARQSRGSLADLPRSQAPPDRAPTGNRRRGGHERDLRPGAGGMAGQRRRRGRLSPHRRLRDRPLGGRAGQPEEPGGFSPLRRAARGGGAPRSSRPAGMRRSKR